jgi:dTMP kinase
MLGLYFVFEGSDGVGKSTAMEIVAEQLRRQTKRNVIETKHPGSTPLGAKLRQIVKDPNLVIDPLARQSMYYTDTIQFINTILQPAMQRGDIVLADRSSHISAAVYGSIDGANLGYLSRLWNVYPSPRANRLYLMRCAPDLAKQRLTARVGVAADYFDDKDIEFHNRLAATYDSLAHPSLEMAEFVNQIVTIDNIRSVDATQPIEQVAASIFADMVEVVNAYDE